MLFRSIIFLSYLLPSFNYASDSTMVIAGKNYKKGPIHHFLFGRHYKKVWETPVKVGVFNIDSVHGGLTPIHRGGNFQTITIRLEAKDGKQYVLRNIDKDPSKNLPKFFRHEFIINIIKEYNTAENPYAPPVIAALEEYAGIFHTNPKIVFVPETNSLSEYKDVIGNNLMLFEERPNGDHSSDSCFGNSSDVVSTSHMLRKRYEDNNHRVDEESYARARLFDMLISDWGRHEDQWRWAAFETGNIKIYKPIPRDRDHAFYRFNDGLFPLILSSSLFKPMFQSFNKGYRKIRELNMSAEFLDRRMLNSLSKQDWIKIADSLKAALSDDKIKRAIKKFPPEIYNVCGKHTTRNLRKRRDLLTSVTKKYYLQLAKEVQIAGSDQAEKFIITMDGKNVTIKIFKIKDGGSEAEIFSRIFFKNETKRILLRGLGGNDSFIVKGKSSRISITAIGDEGNDLFADSSGTVKSKKHIRIFKDPEDKIIHSQKWKISDAAGSIGVFDREGFRHNRVKPKEAGGKDEAEGTQK
jgi:hypothetical protein